MACVKVLTCKDARQSGTTWNLMSLESIAYKRKVLTVSCMATFGDRIQEGRVKWPHLVLKEVGNDTGTTRELNMETQQPLLHSSWWSLHPPSLFPEQYACGTLSTCSYAHGTLSTHSYARGTLSTHTYACGTLSTHSYACGTLSSFS